MARLEKSSKVQGEGDYQAARRYRQRVKEYLDGANVRKAAKQAAPRSRGEAEQLSAAEAAGRKRAKGEDPAIRRRAAPRVGSAKRAKISRH